jgi:hypothetical protein
MLVFAKWSTAPVGFVIETAARRTAGNRGRRVRRERNYRGKGATGSPSPRTRAVLLRHPPAAMGMDVRAGGRAIAAHKIVSICAVRGNAKIKLPEQDLASNQLHS